MRAYVYLGVGVGVGSRIASGGRTFPIFSSTIKEILQTIDCVLIVTDHAAVDYALIGEHARLVVDTRNAMAGVADPKARIIKA